MDRRQAVAVGPDLPNCTNEAVLFAETSGMRGMMTVFALD